MSIPIKTTSGLGIPLQIVAIRWNVENLVDALRDPGADEHEFTPQGKLLWSDDKRPLKLLRISSLYKTIRTDREYGKFADNVAFAESE